MSQINSKILNAGGMNKVESTTLAGYSKDHALGNIPIGTFRRNGAIILINLK